MSLLWRLSALLVVALVLPLARGQDEAEARAKAALALAKAKRERLQSAGKGAQVPTDCHTDYTAAVREAERTGKPMVLWVGVQCSDHPELRRSLKDAVHCHMARRAGQREPGVVIIGGDGIEYVVRPEKIGPNTADRIREAWARPYVPPIRGDVRISEDISYYTPLPRWEVMPMYVGNFPSGAACSPTG